MERPRRYSGTRRLGVFRPTLPARIRTCPHGLVVCLCALPPQLPPAVDPWAPHPILPEGMEVTSW